MSGTVRCHLRSNWCNYRLYNEVFCCLKKTAQNEVNALEATSSHNVQVVEENSELIEVEHSDKEYCKVKNPDPEYWSPEKDAL